MRLAKLYSQDYWDGDRKFGYGGYKYDGRWKPVAEAMNNYYCLEMSERVVDIGCGKGFLLYELQQLLKSPINSFYGCDISRYAHQNSKEEIKLHMGIHNCAYSLFYSSKSADFTYSINVFHNLNYKDLKLAIREMVRVGKEKMYICVESYRTEEELTNLQAWQLTCLSYYSPDDWLQIYEDNGYKGDYEFIYFS